MKKIIISMALLMLIGVPSAVAQGGNAHSSMTKGGGVPQAPVGHRQPRASDVPDESKLSNPNDPVNKEDALLDKKIKSICRGC
ncbi:MAG TPA: hypothetical protein VKR55_16145 [Bradyrhizobium sp.]|uniref:hypothetical protein n=1 Tax=Bradyrhizobium sp. TaxID=376 RepID=UPI002B7E39E2|nr:hypothetical protein [Bradyrhizobium sp.]HLZ03664.1 hypothetical protein [Bradyrhizobium sp.]